MNEPKNVYNDAGERLAPECERAGVLIEKELAGKLTPEESLELSSHISGCADCRDYMADAASIAGAFAEIRNTWKDAPRVAAATPRKGLVLRALPYVVGLAAGVCITAGVLMWRGRNAASGSGLRPPVSAAGGNIASERLGIVLASSPEKTVGAEPFRVGGLGGGPVERRGVREGLLVTAVRKGSWAEKAGILPGDRLLEISGVVLDPEGGRWALDYLLKRARSGNRLDMVLWRDGVGVVRAVYTVPDIL